jgi:hypothetical protein
VQRDRSAFALSLTMKVYFPCLSDLTFLPCAFLSEIVNPGPMVPRSFGTAVVVAVAPVAMPTATSAAVNATASTKAHVAPPSPSRTSR